MLLMNKKRIILPLKWIECLGKNMIEQKEDFNNYMAFFKEQPLKEKQSIIFEQMKVLAGFANQLCNEIGVDNSLLINRELVDLNSSDYSEDDFAEAIIVLVNSIQDSLCDFSDKLCDVLDKVS